MRTNSDLIADLRADLARTFPLETWEPEEMSTAPLAGSIVWLWILMAGGLGAVPIGGAPLPLDEKLAAIAPPECLWYASSAGQAEASGDSANQTEQLLAEPQLREFVDQIEIQIVRALRRAAGPGRQQRVLASEIPVLIKAVLSRPLAAYVEDVILAPTGVDVHAAIVLHAGEQRADVETSIRRLIELAENDSTQIQIERTDAATWSRIVVSPRAPAVRIGWSGDYLVAAVGEKTPEKLLERMEGSAPAWLTEIRENHPIEREQSIGYVNVAGIVQRARSIAPNHEAWPILEKLGILSIQELHGVAGLDEIGCVSDVHLETDGQRSGLLALLPYKPLSKRDLRVIPNNSLTAFATRLDPSETWDEAMRLISRFEPRIEDRVEGALWQIESAVGVDIRREVLRSLDDVWWMYVPSGDLLTSWINAAAAVRVKDADSLRSAIDRAVDAAKAQMARSGRNDVSISESHLEGNVVYALNFNGGPAPLSPAWCVSDEWLIVGLLPGAVRSVLARGADESLAEAPSVQDALDAPEGPSVIAYQDTPQLVQSLYPWLQMGVQMVSSQLRARGVEMDPVSLPSIDVVVRHLRPEVSTMTHTSRGFRFTSRRTLPGSGNLAATAPVGAAMLLPAIQSARRAAFVTQDTNRLKQLALAFHNYADAYNEFPRDIYDDQGVPLLSWRVRLLPYLEEAALYEEFRLDEPWDSPHNRPLIDRMPELLQSTTAPVEEGKTRYVALRGESTLFPGNQRIRFADVLDGTSNTIMFVQAAPAAAVVWTKPADIDFSPERPLAGLESPEGFVLTARCDGSVFRFQLSPDASQRVKALATRAGGEPVEYGE